MKCKECNTKIKKDVQFCPYCGEAITQKEKIGKFTDITVILDRSGSMHYAMNKTIKAYNNYLLEQKQMKSDAIISLHQFNTEYETVYKNVDLQKAPDLTDKTYKPNGGTALFDAIGKTLTEKEYFYKSLSKNKRPKQTLILIVTDGEENSSVEYKLSKIKELIKNKRALGWQFAFIGAEIDAYEEAKQIGVPMGATMSLNSVADFNHGFTSASASTTRYRSTGGVFMFNQDDTSDSTADNEEDTK